MIVEQLEDNFENIPFEEQAKYGPINSFFLTVTMLIRTPGGFFNQLHINKGVKMPLLFLLIILAFSNTINYIYISSNIIDSPSKQIITAMESDPELKPQADNLRSLFSKESKATDILFSIISNFILIYLVALYWHLILKSLQIALNGFEATLRVFCYSSVVLLTSFIPLSTPFLNFAIYIWWSFLMFIGISEAHEVSKKLALRGMTISLFATMIPFIFFVLLIF